MTAATADGSSDAVDTRPRRRPWWARLLVALAVATALGVGAPPAALGFAFITSWGTPGSGDGQFGEPSDVSVAPNFDVYVTDRFNNRVQVFSPLGTFKRAFPVPESFGLDVVGDTVYVSDFGHAVQVLSDQGAFLRKWGSFGTRTDPGQPRYWEPWGIDVGGPDGNVYVADSVNGRVVVTTPTGAFLEERGVGMVSGPFGVAATPGGSVFVADTGNDRIIRLDPGGTFFEFGGTGSGNGQFRSPWDLAFDPGGDLFVVDRANDRIQKVTPNGQFLGAFGGTGGGPGQLKSPEGLAVDAAGNVYVADAGNGRVVRYGDRADLSVTATSFAPSALTVGEKATLALRVANAGPDASRLAEVRVDLPAGFEPVGATATQGGCTLTRPVGCALGTVPAGGAAGVTVTLRATAPGVLPVTAAAVPRTYDPDPTNDAATGSVTASPSPSAAAAGPSLRVVFARFVARWARSHVSGTLDVTLETPRAARVEVALLKGERAAGLSASAARARRPVQRWTIALPRAGQGTRHLKLSRRLLPGAYTVRARELGAPSGGVLAAGSRAVRLAAPPQGVVSSAFISRGVGGKGVRRIRSRLPGFIFANFRLAALPRVTGRLRVDWHWSGRSGTVASKGVRPVQGLVVSPLRNSTGPLPPGRYRAVLRYGSVVLAQAGVRLG